MTVATAIATEIIAVEITTMTTTITTVTMAAVGAAESGTIHAMQTKKFFDEINSKVVAYGKLYDNNS